MNELPDTLVHRILADNTICKQQQKILELEKQIEEAENVIKFYGDKDNWRSTNHLCAMRITLGDRDYMQTHGYSWGGKLAREYLNKYNKEGEK